MIQRYTAGLDYCLVLLYTALMKIKPQIDLATVLRKAIDQDGRSLYAVAKAAGVAYQGLHPFVRGRRQEINLSTADRLCKVLGLELRPKSR